MYEALIVIVFQTKKKAKLNRVTTIFKDTNFGKLTYSQMSIIYISIQDRVFLLLLLIFCGSLRSVKFVKSKIKSGSGIKCSHAGHTFTHRLMTAIHSGDRYPYSCVINSNNDFDFAG